MYQGWGILNQMQKVGVGCKSDTKSKGWWLNQMENEGVGR